MVKGGEGLCLKTPWMPSVYRKLQQKLDQLPIGFPATASGVEIRILKHLFTPEQAQIAVSMSFIPEPATVIHKRLKKKYPVIDELETILDQMAAQGSIARSITREGVKIFSITMLAIGMFEFQVEHLTKAFYEDFKQYIDEKFRDALLNPKFTQLRPVPTAGSITPDLNIMPYDDIRGVLTRHRGPFLVVDCICKEGQDLLGHPCKVTQDRQICLLFGTCGPQLPGPRLGTGNHAGGGVCHSGQGRTGRPGGATLQFSISLLCLPVLRLLL